MEPCPAESINLSLLIQSVFSCVIFKYSLNNTVPTSAIPSGIPGWPEFALSTAAADSTRTDLVTSLNIYFLTI